MAFHPFNIFRKHQKVWFAVLTIVCMFVFILQFGSGDIFQRLLGGGHGGGGEKLVSLYGKDLTSADVAHVRQSRQFGNELILAALQTARKPASQDLEDYKPDLTNLTDNDIQKVRESWLKRKTEIDQLDQKQQELLRHLQDPGADQGVKEAVVAQLQQMQQQIQLYQQFLYPQEVRQDYTALLALQGRLGAADKSDPAKTKEQEAAVANLRFLLRAEFFEGASAASPFYFGGGVKDPDLLDFEIWKHQAETLGLVLTKADARRALAFEAGGNGLPTDPGGSWKADPAFTAVFAAHPELTEEQAAKAVEDEFCVHMAQNLFGAAVSGVDVLEQAERLPPNPPAPYDFWAYFRDNRTTLKIAFLALPAESFVSQVTETPTPGELLALYNQGRSNVPDPSSAAPAFKDPRKTRIEYLTAASDSAYYKALIDHVQYNRIRSCFDAVLPVNTAGGGVVPGVILADALSRDPLADERTAEDPMAADYTDARAGRRAGATEAAAAFGLGSSGLSAWSSPTILFLASTRERERETSRLGIAGRRTIASLASKAGSVLGLQLGGPSAWSAPAASEAFAKEKEQEAARLASAGLALPLIGSATGAPFAGLAGALTPYQALEQVIVQAPEKPYTDLADRYFWEDQRKKDLSRLVDDDLEQFAKALPDEIKRAREEGQKQNAENQGKNAPPIEDLDQYAYDKAELFIKAQCSKYGWELHNGASLDDVFHIPTDPALQPLLQAPDLTQEFRGSANFAKAVVGQQAPPLYAIMGPYPMGAAPTKYLYWRTEEQRERDYGEGVGQVPDAVLPLVKETWRKQQASKLALRKAKEISDAAKTEWAKFAAGSQGQQDNLMQFLVDRNLGRVFVLDKVSRLLPVPNKDEHGLPYNDYSAYTIPASQIADPPPGLLDRLLALEKPGDTYIFKDKPVNNVYLAMLEQREAPSYQSDDWHKEFTDDYRSATDSPKIGLWQKFLTQRRQDYQKELMHRLRAEAGPVDDQGQLILSSKGEKQPQSSGSENEPPPEPPPIGF